MDESRKKRPLADDPSFISSLSDLDRGLTGPGEDEFPEEANKISTPVRRLRRRRIVRRRRPPASGAAPARAPSPTSATAAPAVSPPTTPAPASPTAVAPMPAAPAPVEPTVPDPPAPPTLQTASDPQSVGGRRPLLDLFPQARDAREQPPGPTGTEGGPSARRVRRRRLGSSAPKSAGALPVVPAESLPYETFYGLTEKPFSLSTDPVFLYHSTAHDRTAQALLTSIGTRPGVVVITGPFGVGKTTLCRAVIEELDRRTLTSFLVDPFLTVDELLQTLLIDFGALSRADLAGGREPSTDQLRDTLQSFLASLASLQASAVVLVDEAQSLPVPVLDELRALSEITDGRRLLHVVLVGEPDLVSMLKQEALRPLNAQVAVRSALGPLLSDEVSGYVMHRVDVAGNGSPVVFSETALARIHQLTSGVPRVVNLLCDRAMSRGFEASARVIELAHVDAAATDLDLSVPVTETARTVRLAVQVLAFVLLMLMGAGAALWVFRDEVHRTIVQWERVPPAPSAPRLPQSEPLRVPSVPVSGLPRIRPGGDNRLAPPAI